MLTKKTPETFKGTPMIRALGEANILALTYYNRTSEQIGEALSKFTSEELPEAARDNPVSFINAQALLFIVKSFDDGTDADFPLTLEGLLSMESHYPGILVGLTEYFHTARRASVEKN